MTTQHVGRRAREAAREASQKHAEEHRKDHAERGTVKQQEPTPSTITVTVKLGTGPTTPREENERTLSSASGAPVVNDRRLVREGGWV